MHRMFKTYDDSRYNSHTEMNIKVLRAPHLKGQYQFILNTNFLAAFKLQAIRESLLFKSNVDVITAM